MASSDPLPWEAEQKFTNGTKDKVDPFHYEIHKPIQMVPKERSFRNKDIVKPSGEGFSRA